MRIPREHTLRQKMLFIFIPRQLLTGKIFALKANQKPNKRYFCEVDYVYEPGKDFDL